MLNLWLLFHKCGNNYTVQTHKFAPHVNFVSNAKIASADSLANEDISDVPVNVRCRNFNAAAIRKTQLLADDDLRALVFLRHPASFLLSAMRYHHRGTESWAMNDPQPHLDGATLTGALQAAPDDESRLLITMAHFTFIPKRMASLMEFSADKRFRLLRCEDLFTQEDPEYFKELATFLRLGSDEEFIAALGRASPANKEKLPRHSTGAFKVDDPYSQFTGRAKEHYDEFIRPFANSLGY